MRVAALPMYDWPELRASVDAAWAKLRAQLQAAGVQAPEGLARRNADLPPVPGGIRDAHGRVIAPDPATLPPDELDLATLWRHPDLLVAQTCWGPMEAGLAAHVEVVGQPSYAGMEGGNGTSYTSAILMRHSDGEGRAAAPGRLAPPQGTRDVRAPADGSPLIPVGPMRGKRLAFNVLDSMSGLIALSLDSVAWRKYRHVRRTDHDGLASRLDRRGRRGEGRHLRRRLPELGHRAAPRAGRRRRPGRRLDGNAQRPPDDRLAAPRSGRAEGAEGSPVGVRRCLTQTLGPRCCPGASFEARSARSSG